MFDPDSPLELPPLSTSPCDFHSLNTPNSNQTSQTSATLSLTSTTSERDSTSGDPISRTREVGAYEISIGSYGRINPSDKPRWVVACHMVDGNTCQLHSIVGEANTAERKPATLFRSANEHWICEHLNDRRVLGMIQDRDLREFSDLFEQIHARDNTSFIAFWLELCVRQGLLERCVVGEVLEELGVVVEGRKQVPRLSGIVLRCVNP
ncbi:hypothetical protein BJX99DRAFT_263636 [Aspergillus californicus]